jgi:outer membrane protein assembly factor BamD (BamD/ComL family)
MMTHSRFQLRFSGSKFLTGKIQFALNLDKYRGHKAALDNPLKIGTFEALDQFMEKYPNSEWMDKAKYYKGPSKNLLFLKDIL